MHRQCFRYELKRAFRGGQSDVGNAPAAGQETS
jgi:hypothetical protein